MDIMTLEVQAKDGALKSKFLRRKNLIPAQYYGRGVKNRSLQIDYQTFRRLFRIAGTNTILELNVDGKDKLTVLVHDVQYNPVTDSIDHVDFINVRMDEVIHTKIPLKFVGIAPAVKELGGILTHTLKEVEVKCLPEDLIQFIEVNVEPIVNFHSYVRIKDLKVPTTITILHNPEDVVLTAVAPKIEEEAPVAATAEASAATSVAGETTEGAVSETPREASA